MGRGWSEKDLPDLSGRVCVVTGGNSGLGLETARALAGAGAHVVIACRDAGRAEGALEEIRSGLPSAKVEALSLDLASLRSVRAFAAELGARHPAVHVLVNNAGVMALPRRETEDGFELQLGTNHLGHFALTGLLLPRLLAAPDPRVVTLSSTMHRAGRIDFEDLHGRRRYRKWPAYAQSKLANLLFTLELARRAERAGVALRSVGAHPGYAATNLQAAGPRMEGARLAERVMALGNRVLAQGAAEGARPTLYAAAAPEARNGGYYGPDGPLRLWGHPREESPSRAARDQSAAGRLWEVSELLTGVRWEALPRSVSGAGRPGA